jgi:putative hydrolase of the HAD superfamily
VNPSNDLRAIFLDIDDTMFTTTAFVKLAREKAMQAMIDRGLDIPLERALEELAAVVAEFGSNDDRHYNRLLLRLPKKLTRKINQPLLVTAGVIAYHETKWEHLRIDEEAVSLLQDLSTSGLLLGVISAGLLHKQMEKILRLRMDDFVDPNLIFITDQVGIAKSNPKLYRLAARAAGVKPHQAMHVGDHPISDIQTAKEAGLIAIWHRGAGKYAHLQPSLPPDHEIRSLADLRPLLKDIYGVL